MMEINHEIHEKHEMAKTGEIVLFDRVLVILERAFYLVFENRLEILSPVGRESADNEKLFLILLCQINWLYRRQGFVYNKSLFYIG